MVHRSRPKQVHVDHVSLSEGSRDLGALIVKVVLNVGCDNLLLPDNARDEDPVVI